MACGQLCLESRGSFDRYSLCSDYHLGNILCVMIVFGRMMMGMMMTMMRRTRMIVMMMIGGGGGGGAGGGEGGERREGTN